MIWFIMIEISRLAFVILAKIVIVHIVWVCFQTAAKFSGATNYSSLAGIAVAPEHGHTLLVGQCTIWLSMYHFKEAPGKLEGGWMKMLLHRNVFLPTNAHRIILCGMVLSNNAATNTG